VPAKLSQEERLKLIERVILKGESVSKVCEEAGISRVLFYRWLKRYKDEGKITPKKPSGVSSGRVPKEVVLKIISWVRKNPTLPTWKVSKVLGKDKKDKPVVGNHGVQKVFLRLNLNTIEKREEFAREAKALTEREALDLASGSLKAKQAAAKAVELSPNQRLEAIERVVKYKVPVAQVCIDFGISRPNFYKWLKRYKQVPEEMRLEVMENKKPEVERYYRQTPEKYEEAVLSAVEQYPEFGVEKIVKVLPEIAGEPIVGYHGVQNILRRHDLNTYEKRLTYARSQITPVTKLVAMLVRLGTRFAVLPAPTRARVIRFASILLLTAFSSVVFLGSLGYISTIFGQAPTAASRIGLVFASVALGAGSIFFAYSMKYYLTLGLVLSFSRQSEAEGGGYTMSLSGRVKHDNGSENGNGPSTGSINSLQAGSGWLQRIFGLVSAGSPSYRSWWTAEGKGGLQPSLDHVKLKRFPFVSIHLPFYNEKKVAERLLEACASMKYKNYEIIVCDDSTDETTEIVQRYADRHNKVHPSGPKIKVLHRLTRAGFKGGALGEALKASDPRTEFVVVFDADFVPYPDTLEIFVKNFQANGLDISNCKYQIANIHSKNQKEETNSDCRIAVVGGYQWHVLNKSENWITRGVRTEYSGSYVIERPGQELLGAMKLISGSVYMIRADILRQIGWGTSITEDFQLTLKLYEKGYKVVYTPYVQAPAECVSTLKRLIRQRMRWAEGHSNNIRRMFRRLMFGYWKTDDREPVYGRGGQKTERVWVKSPLTAMEKLEFLYLSPYYLQAAFFLIGTFSWLLAETVFRARLPFWTSLWGWSLVLTNLLSLPLMNAVGLFLEESEERDYLGILSFVVLSYILVPFQAYASVKGFLEKEEGPWFRTPKTGKITDIFTRGRFYRWISGILPGRVRAPAFATSIREGLQVAAYSRLGNYAPLAGEAGLRGKNNPYLALATANNRFDSFSIRPRKRKRWVRALLAILLSVTTTLVYLSRGVEVVYATNMTGPMKLGIGAPSGEDPWPTGGNWLQNAASFGTGSLFYFAVVGTSFRWYTQLLPTGGWDAMVPKGAYSVNIAKRTGPAVGNIINYSVQLLLTNSAGGLPSQLLGAAFSMNNTNADNTIFNLPLGTLGSNQTITAAAKKRLAVNIYITSQNHPSRPKFNWVINNGTVPAQLMIPANIVVPEIPRKTVFVILIGIMPAIPVLMKLRLERKKRQKRKGEKGWTQEFNEFLDKLTGRKEVVLDELPV